MKQRSVVRHSASVPVIEGAGVRLHRAFGFGETSLTDPFLLLDDFRGDDPADYIAGFPWHPHRGIETITYMLTGRVEHGDSLDNAGVIGPGDVQWMTAGSGIVHQEMPKPAKDGRMGGFQLWANLPRGEKMTRPKYRDIGSGMIPVVQTPAGASVRVICGEVDGIAGPVKDITIGPEYLDVTIPAGTAFVRDFPKGTTVCAYIFEGEANFNSTKARNRDLLIFGGEGPVTVGTGRIPVRFLLISGSPLKEPVAWAGPIVMNTQEELRTAFREYEEGTFLKHRKSG